MNNSEDKEFQFIFKLNKITQLLKYVDAYYQKEILKDIQRYTSSVNQQVQSCNKDVRKTKSFEILNIYLENIINEQLIYLIDVYHKDNKEQIIKNAEKEALKIVNQKICKGNVRSNIDQKVNTIKEDFCKTIDLSENKLNLMIHTKINEFFEEIKTDLIDEVKDVMHQNNHSEYIQKKIKEFLKVFIKDETIYHQIAKQFGNEIYTIQKQCKTFEKKYKDINGFLEKYINRNEQKYNEVENNIFKKINGSLKEKIILLTEIVNQSIKSSLENVNSVDIKENDLMMKLEKKIYMNNQQGFSKNNFDIHFNKEENIIELYYFNDLISSTQLNIKGLIGPRGPQGVKGDKGDITIIRNIDITPEETIKFTIQNGSNLYDINSGKLPKGPKGDKGDTGNKGEPGDVNINLRWNQDDVMRLNRENNNNLQILKSISVGDKGHCIKPNALSIGNSINYKENSFVIGDNAKTLDENSVALFGSTLGKNAFSYNAEDVDENCVAFGIKEQDKYNIEKIILKAGSIEFDTSNFIINDSEFKNKHIYELEEKINQLHKELNLIKQNL